MSAKTKGIAIGFVLGIAVSHLYMSTQAKQSAGAA